MKINIDCEIERAISKDITRYHLSTGAYLDVEKKRLAATDGHCLAIVPAEPGKGDHSGWITPDALKAARKAAKKAKGTDAEVQANGVQVVPGAAVTFARPAPEGAVFPPIDQVIPEYKPGDAGTVTIGLNAALLLELAKAIGAQRFPGNVPVTLTVKLPEKPGDDVLDPIRVEGGAVGALGVLMPCRV